MSSPCGHPLAARAVRVRDGIAVTGCWACDVERYIYDLAEADRADQQAYWREAQRRSRARRIA